MADEKKWYQKDYGKILLSLIFFPVGLYLVWTSKEGLFQSKNSKIIMSVITFIFLIFAFSSESSKQKEMDEKYSQVEKLFDENKIEEGLKLLEESKEIPLKKPKDTTIEKYGSKLHEYYFKLASEEYTKLTQNKGSYENFTKIIDKAKSWGSIPEKLTKLEKDSIRFKVVGDTRKAYSFCKDAVEDKLNDPGSAEFEYGTLELLAANALVKVGADINTPTESIFKINSWVRAKNAFGVLIKKGFYCEVSFSKETESPTLRKLNF